ncbi:HAD family hydrolase [Halobaculum sp. CBA1158]|uniref:HAD family hydrolase n=1 Tax=Halobaculum sp. CBA1158 TaxID=2904243 RepID=UPI001F3F2536|nr:HAD family hydrolase [Halobaculum sp. CBA1158]UIP00295.1 HAD family hydrolase [Halobaculum sp. CBA1158]
MAHGDARAGDVRAGESTDGDGPVAAVSLDLFGTLVDADRPSDPAGAIATALRDQGVSVSEDWETAYATPHLDHAPGVERPLHHHVAAALAGDDPDREPRAFVDDAAAAVRAAFDRPVETRPGATEAVAALAAERPVGVLSNCSVPGLVEQSLERSGLDPDALDAVVASVACGWRKPDPRAFEAVADGLGVSVGRLCHVGDDPATDGGIRDAGGRFVRADADGVSLAELPAVVGRRWG